MDPILLGCGACILLIAMLVVYIFFLLSMSKALSLCAPRNQTLAPGLVWLGLIPIFHVVWLFVIVVQIAASLKKEFRSRRIDDGGSYGLVLGLSACGLYIVSFVLNVIGRFDPDFNLFVAMPFGFVVLGIWIAYWIKIAGHSGALRRTDRYDDDDYDDDYDDRRRDDDDDYDDRRGRRRRRDDDDRW